MVGGECRRGNCCFLYVYVERKEGEEERKEVKGVEGVRDWVKIEEGIGGIRKGRRRRRRKKEGK
jgi:hypothetical protein